MTGGFSVECGRWREIKKNEFFLHFVYVNVPNVTGVAETSELFIFTVGVSPVRIVTMVASMGKKDSLNVSFFLSF